MDVGSSSSMELPQQFRQFTISEIHLATQNFDELLVIGRGGFGMVYKGIITNGENDLVSAIKRLDLTSSQGALEFWNEVHMLSNLRHCHLVSLIGYCNDGQEIILVYEYIAQGSLEDHLHKFQSSLPWVRRLKICIGAARGLDYLHTGTGIKHGIIHRDIKSSNILLDDNWAARISDFGLSKTGPINQPATYVKTFVKGTFGYLDPDYYATGRLTRKSDVYAFGVVLFEVLSGKRAVDQSLDEEHWGLVNWAQESMKEGRVKQIVDCNIRESILPKCLKKFTKLADWCLHSNPKQRPTMAEVVVCLESVLALQEKASYTLHPAGMRIFGNKMPMFLSSRNGDKSVGSKRSLELYFDSIGGENRILRRFEFEIIKIANENFSENNKISQWSDGFMYKGRLHNGQGVSIARQESDSPGQLYKNEVSLLVKLEHEHLLRLLGYCIEGTQVFLVYDFAISSCLDRVMDDPECTLLDWNKRKKILVTIASVLMYLHQHDVLHGNVTPSNILLDESLDPKLSDFGLARYVATNNDDGTEVHQIYGIGLNTFEESKWPHPLTWNTLFYQKVFIPHRKAYRPLFVRRTYSQLIPAGVKPAGSQPYFLTYGTMGYIAPEYVTSSCLSTKADVYSFGVVILETVTGCSIRNYVNSRKENMTFQHYVWRNWLEETSSNIIHPRLHVDLSSITRIIHIGLLCVQVDHVDRPTMDKVVGMLTNTLSLALHMPKVYTTTFSSLMEKYSYNTNASEELLLTNDYDPTEVDDYILELCPR